jgi:hypothetical protein
MPLATRRLPTRLTNRPLRTRNRTGHAVVSRKSLLAVHPGRSGGQAAPASLLMLK